MAFHVLLQQQEYCPPINPALIHMLFPDYAPNDVGLLKSTLEGMKDDALAEQVTEFDAREAQARRTTARFQHILSPEGSV
jgi:predicted metal-dependent hydrolase